MYAAAFHPEYMNITGTSAKRKLVTGTAPADPWRFAGVPTPNESPSAMNTMKAVILSVVRMLLTSRPGPTPRTWTSEITITTAIAISVWRENVIGRYGTGITRNGVVSATPGMKRLR